MDAIILYSTLRLLDSSVSNPRKFIRAIYLGGSFSILIFIILRVVLS